jgi:hypothetical protein
MEHRNRIFGSCWYHAGVLDALHRLFSDDSRVAFALVFGSSARGSAGPQSDLDVAIGVSAGHAFSIAELGDLCAQIERVARRPVDLVLLDEAPPALAFRVFRDGHVVAVRDARALANRKAKAVLDYLDFQPIEDLCTRGVLDAASRGR